jgi:short-subunit dehydrogenase
MTRPVALVTGASAGIGRELARLLAVDHDLILTARREAELLALAAEFPAKCLVLPEDLSDPAGPKRLLHAVAESGWTIDTFVNNAGFGDVGPFADADSAKLAAMIQVNITAFTELLRGVLPGMKVRGRGRILNVGSVAGFQPGPFMAVYYATKAYVNSLSEAVASELAGTGITVTCLCPGPVETEFAAAAGFEPGGFSAGAKLAARDVAAAGIRALNRGHVRVIPGWRNRLMIALQRFVPRFVVTRTVKLMLRQRVESETRES